MQTVSDYEHGLEGLILKRILIKVVIKSIHFICTTADPSSHATIVWVNLTP